MDAILDAADAVFLEMGFANATTNHVAARAGTSIGSLYRFFPDKDALLVALAERYGERLRAIAADLTQPEVAQRWTLEGLVGFGIETFSQFLVASPGFKTLLEEVNNPVLQAGSRAHDHQMAGLVSALHAQLAPHRPPEEQETVVEVMLAVLGCLQGLALRGDDLHRRRILKEATRMMSLYLSDRLGIPCDAVLGG